MSFPIFEKSIKNSQSVGVQEEIRRPTSGHFQICVLFIYKFICVHICFCTFIWKTWLALSFLIFRISSIRQSGLSSLYEYINHSTSGWRCCPLYACVDLIDFVLFIFVRYALKFNLILISLWFTIRCQTVNKRFILLADAAAVASNNKKKKHGKCVSIYWKTNNILRWSGYFRCYDQRTDKTIQSGILTQDYNLKF